MSVLWYDGGMSMTEATETRERKKPGPAPRPNTDRTSLIIDTDLIEWGKTQPGGLSETVRRLLREAKDKAEGRA